MFQRRLPALPHTAPANDPQSKYDDRYQYTMNRVRGLQSQVPLSRSLDPSSQQVRVGNVLVQLLTTPTHTCNIDTSMTINTLVARCLAMSTCQISE